MVWRAKAKSRVNAYGVAKIQRATYNTRDGVSAKGGWWEIRAAVFKRDKGKCVPCANKGISAKAVECHHIKSITDGGETIKSNLISVCEKCHDARHKHLHRASASGATGQSRFTKFGSKPRPKPKF